MIESLIVLFGASILIGLYYHWKLEQRRRQLLVCKGGPHNCSHPDGRCRQSQRYEQSSLYASHSYVEPTFHSFTNKFTSYSSVALAMQKAGLEACRMVLGIDFSASNEWQGRQIFQRNSLHALLLKDKNPYEKVIQILGSTLEPFSDTGEIYAFGFGDAKSKDHSVFSFMPAGQPCNGFKHALARYRDIVKNALLSGPTSYAPLIYKAIELTEESKSYHILVIISDGQLQNDAATSEALIRASYYPLSIILVGVGDGPFEKMEIFDDFLTQRKFDNFQFVNFHSTTSCAKKRSEAAFALHALMEIPDQYKAIKRLGYLA